MGGILEAALSYAEAGHRVFPIWGVRPDGSCQCNDTSCGSPGKHPHGRLVPRGLHDASDDEETIRAWWRQYPQANVGLVTGELFFVIDCDKAGDVDGTTLFLAMVEEWGGMPPTACADTGGGGAHFCFAMDDDVPVRNQQGLLVNGTRITGIDVRGVGGYIVAPPSVHHSGRVYTWKRDLDDLKAAPMGLLTTLAKAGPAPGTPLPMSGFEPSNEAAPPPLVAPIAGRIVPEPEVARVRDALACIPANIDRTTWLERVAMPLHDLFGGSEQGFELFHEWSASAQGSTTPSGKPAYRGEAEVRKVWRSLHSDHRNPKGAATLFELAGTHGYRSNNGQAPPQSWPEPGVSGPSVFDPEELAALADEPTDPGPFPESVVANLEGPIGELCVWIHEAARRPDPVISFAAALAIVAACAGRRVVGPEGSRATLTMAVLAPSGSGKDKPQECIKNLLESHPNLMVGLMDDTPTHRTQLDDLLLKRKGQALMVLDEYGSTLQRWLKQNDMASASMSPTIRRLATHGSTIYHLAPVSLRHPSRAADTAAWDAGIFAPAFSLVGFATPGQFYDALSESSLTDGFLGRHVVLASRSTRDLRTPARSSLDVPEGVSEWLAAVEATPIPRVGPPRSFAVPPPAGAPVQPPDMAPSDPASIEWASEATSDAWSALTREIDKAAHKAIGRGDETLGAILRRLPGQIVTLALVLACGEASTLRGAVVTEGHLDAAYRIARWSADHLAWKLRRGVASSDFQRAMLATFGIIDRAAGKKIYRSQLVHRVSIAEHLGRVWKSLGEDPRYVLTAKWVHVRPVDDAPPSEKTAG